MKNHESTRRDVGRQFPSRVARLLALGTSFVCVVASQTHAQTVAPAFSGSYSITNLGTPTGVPGPLGGVVLKYDDPNTLLIGGAANGGAGAIYSIGVTRDANSHIIGFSSTATLFASAPNIDGGLAYGPGNVLFYTAYPTNQIGQIKPGSTSPDKVVTLANVSSSVGSLNFVPAGFPGAGGFRIASYNGGGFYSATLTPDGSGTYDIGPQTLLTSPGFGPEGFVYVPPGSPLFSGPNMLISEYGAGRVSAYQVDANGAPVVASRVDFITGLTGAEGAFIDPLTGDFFFSTFGGGNQLIEVRGFNPLVSVPEPGTATLSLCLACGAVGAGYWNRRRRGAAWA